MALLDVQQLTMRFSGLTAVSQVSFEVPEGSIYSIIGPNGAGKTTVFNVVTGIYEPTEGVITLHGHPEELPLTWTKVLAFFLIGLATGLGLLLASVNIDSLWIAAIKRNTEDPDHRPFTYGNAVADGFAFMRGRLDIELVDTGRYRVLSHDGKVRLGVAPTREAAEQRKADLEAIIAKLPGDVPIVKQGDEWVIPSPRPDKEALFRFPNEADARAQAQILTQVAETAAAHRRNALIALIAGIVIGALGAYSVWRRARRTPEVIALQGIARTFQNIRLFQNMTVQENVLIAMERSFRKGPLGMLIAALGLNFQERVAKVRALHLLDFVNLEHKANYLAKELPYGEQRRLEIARAMATNPQLLLLDEPAAGMNPIETEALMELIGDIRKKGITILLIEHHMSLVMAISDRIVVLDHGVKIAEGTPQEIRDNPAVIEAYLGKEEVS